MWRLEAEVGARGESGDGGGPGGAGMDKESAGPGSRRVSELLLDKESANPRLHAGVIVDGC